MFPRARARARARAPRPVSSLSSLWGAGASASWTRRGLASAAAASPTPLDERLALEAEARAGDLTSLAREQWRVGADADSRTDLAPALEPYGRLVAKIDAAWVAERAPRRAGKLVLVTAVTPTPSGEGKTCCTVGLADGLRSLGARATPCLREPSLGPVFGKKGGAAGGGRSQLVPLHDINLHFTGDIHAVGSAHNLLSAMIENHLHWNEPAPDLDPRRVAWRHVVDMQDRSLRNIVVGLGGRVDGVPREDGFDITVASEVMAVLCLSRSLPELRERLGRVVVGYDRSGKRAVTAKDLGADGAMTALLVKALRPNVVQSLERTLALVHGGPFANIAHGCSSLAATETALRLSDYVVTEAGFGADLGAEKFFDIKCRQAGLEPAAVVLVATVRALKMHGGVPVEGLAKPDVPALVRGTANLKRHVENLAKFGYTPVVAVNRFPTDTDEELRALVGECERVGARAVVATHYADGSAGSRALAQVVREVADGSSAKLRFLYDDADPLKDKVRTVAREIYRAKDVEFSPTALAKLEKFQAEGHGRLPVCIAKTQYSFSDDARALNAPEGHTLHVADARLSAGAGFVVVITGSIMTMPGLPRVPAARNISVGADGRITGLL